MKRAWACAGLALLLCVVALGGCGNGENGDGTEQQLLENTPDDAKLMEPPFQQQSFQNIKTPHYISSTPANNELLMGPVTEVAIFFNFTVVEPSSISVTRDGVEVTEGPTVIALEGLSMTVAIGGAATGNYSVSYTAYWPDRSYHVGSYGFSVQAQ